MSKLVKSLIILVFICLSFTSQAVAAEVVCLDSDERFDDSVAEDAMYSPKQFRHGGIYLTEPVSSEKDVVVFVHGFKGHPGNFRNVVKNLDSSRYQAWLVYYPSGLGLDEAGHLLARQVQALAQEHGVSRLQVFAHSMGGLVAWKMVTALSRTMAVEDLVTVATPWNGHWATRWGVLFSRNPVASWVDLVPYNETLQSIWHDKDRPNHKLVYALTEDSDSAEGDGTIQRSSQLVPDMTQQATRTVKLIGTHMSVLEDSSHVKALVALLE